MLITLVIRLESAGGNDGWAMASLNCRCGSGVMRQIDELGEVCKEWGRATLRGLSRCWSVMNFLEVRISQIGSTSEGIASGEAGSEIRRFLVVERVSFCFVLEPMCLRSALDARSVCWT